MARVNVYLPDPLVEEVRAAGLNLSQVTQGAVVHELTRTRLSYWLDRVALERAMYVPNEVAFEALVAARDSGDGSVPRAKLELGRRE
jgi:post-segregation antitoxin (ccd killing protein)